MRRRPRQDPSPGESRYASGERWWDHKPIEEYDAETRQAVAEADRIPQDSRTLGDKIRENAWKAAHTLFPATMRHVQNPLFPYYDSYNAEHAPKPINPYDAGRYRKSTELAPDDPLPRFEQPQS